MKTKTMNSKPASSASRLTIKSGIKGGIRQPGGGADPNHNQTRVKLIRWTGGGTDANHNRTRVRLAIKSGIRGGICQIGGADPNHSQTRVGLAIKSGI